MAENTVERGLWLRREKERLGEQRHHTLQDEALPARHKDRITSESGLGVGGGGGAYKAF